MDLSSLWGRARPYVPVWAYPLFGPLYRANARLAIKRMEQLDRQYESEPGAYPVPPAALRFRVVGYCSPAEFELSGSRARQEIESALQQVGQSIDRFCNALDFGCGCGRTLRAFSNRPSTLSLAGMDIDPEAIAWCQQHLPIAKFEVNSHAPPLGSQDESFDLIWALSVFTHLPEKLQFDWLSELRRVLKPGGYLVATVHGPRTWMSLPEAEVRRIRADGFVFARVPALTHVFPDWYQTAWHTRAYVESRWSAVFDVELYLPEGLGGYQDLVVLKKR